MIVWKNKDWSGRLSIDGEDAYDKFGVFALDGEYKNLIQVPSFKKIDSTEWKEHDGAEYDLFAPELGSKSIQIEFGITDIAALEELAEWLSDGAYHEFYFSELDKTYNLRLTQNGSVSQQVKLGKVKLTFSDDFPNIPDAQPSAEPCADVKQRSYRLDDIDFSRYGVWVLEGSDESIRKLPAVRAALSTDIRTSAGVIYDAQDVRYKTKDITLKCLIHADSVSDFWGRYNALFTTLTQPDAREFYFEPLDRVFECYYKSNSVSKFKIMKNGHVWCEFNLVLCCIGLGLRPDTYYIFLATESGEYIVLEDGETLIRLN